MAELVFLVPFGTGNSVAAVPVAWVCTNIGLWYGQTSRSDHRILIQCELLLYLGFGCAPAASLVVQLVGQTRDSVVVA